MQACVCVHASVCVCVCVCEWERERGWRSCIDALLYPKTNLTVLFSFFSPNHYCSLLFSLLFFSLLHFLSTSCCCSSSFCMLTLTPLSPCALLPGRGTQDEEKDERSVLPFVSSPTKNKTKQTNKKDLSKQNKTLVLTKINQGQRGRTEALQLFHKSFRDSIWYHHGG